MGMQDRKYYQDSYSSPWGGGSSYGSDTGQRSIIVTLIIINVAIFVADMFTPALPGGGAHWLSEFLALKPAEIFSAPWNAWKFLSYGFAHASVNSRESFFHVGGNMLVLFMLGRPIEQRLGRAEFLKFYILAILVAAAGFFAINFSDAKGMVGASGAVSAVVALFIFYYPNSTLLVFGVLPVRTWILGVILVVMDLLRSLNPASHIAWEAHLSGFAFGAAYHYFKWNFSRLEFGWLTKMFSNRPNLKIHEPAKLQKEADAILQKINEQGEESLTSRERKTLQKYSNQLRKNRDP